MILHFSLRLFHCKTPYGLDSGKIYRALSFDFSQWQIREFGSFQSL